MKQKYDAIYEEDLEGFLLKYNELHEIENGNRFCKICSTPININNIQFVIYNKEKSFEYICNSIECVEKYHYL